MLFATRVRIKKGFLTANRDRNSGKILESSSDCSSSDQTTGSNILGINPRTPLSVDSRVASDPPNPRSKSDYCNNEVEFSAPQVGKNRRKMTHCPQGSSPAAFLRDENMKAERLFSRQDTWRVLTSFWMVLVSLLIGKNHSEPYGQENRGTRSTAQMGQVRSKFGNFAYGGLIATAMGILLSISVVIQADAQTNPPAPSDPGCTGGRTWTNISDLATVTAAPNSQVFGIYQSGTAWDLNFDWTSPSDPPVLITFDFGSLQLNNPAFWVDDIDADSGAWIDVVTAPFGITIPAGTLAYSTSGNTATGISDTGVKHFYSSSTSTTNTSFNITYGPGSSPSDPVAQHVLLDVWHCHPAEADLSIYITANNIVSAPGQSISATINNGGPQGTNGVTAEIVFPACIAVTSASGANGSFSPTPPQPAGTNPFTWTISNTINSGSSRTANFTVDASACATGSSQTMTAEVMTATEYDPDSTPGNGSTSEDDYDTEVFTLITPEPDIAVNKVVSNSTPDQGTGIFYILIANNAGTQDATSVIIQETLPAGFTYQFATGDGTFDNITHEWNVGSLDVGESKSINVHGLASGTVGSV